jgi:hypothetical protein
MFRRMLLSAAVALALTGSAGGAGRVIGWYLPHDDRAEWGADLEDEPDAPRVGEDYPFHDVRDLDPVSWEEETEWLAWSPKVYA